MPDGGTHSPSVLAVSSVMLCLRLSASSKMEWRRSWCSSDGAVTGLGSISQVFHVELHAAECAYSIFDSSLGSDMVADKSKQSRLGARGFGELCFISLWGSWGSCGSCVQETGGRQIIRAFRAGTDVALWRREGGVSRFVELCNPSTVFRLGWEYVCLA